MCHTANCDTTAHNEMWCVYADGGDTGEFAFVLRLATNTEEIIRNNSYKRRSFYINQQL